jgi:hypothetical protein
MANLEPRDPQLRDFDTAGCETPEGQRMNRLLAVAAQPLENCPAGRFAWGRFANARGRGWIEICWQARGHSQHIMVHFDQGDGGDGNRTLYLIYLSYQIIDLTAKLLIALANPIPLAISCQDIGSPGCFL